MQKLVFIQLLFLLSVASMSGCKTTSASSHSSAANTETKEFASNVAAGTYKIKICEGACNADPHAIEGILVVDKSRSIFSKQSDAMLVFMRSQSRVPVPNYCYFFDPKTSNSKGSLFEYDVVGFGEMNIYKGANQFEFILSSPDFRYMSDVQTAGTYGFTGNWHSSYANDGGSTQSFADVQLHAQRIAEANASICFDAARKFNRMELQSICAEFPQKTCEPGLGR
jgi:hypothetical protein